MNRWIPHLLAVVVAVGTLFNTGCLGAIHVGGGIVVAEPELAYVGPGVWVVQDYDEPVFYASGRYWVQRNGYWYRSRVHHGSWARVGVRVVPVHIRRVKHPRRYVRYHARPGVRTRRGPGRTNERRDHRDRRHKVKTRDHRKKSGVKTRDYRKKKSGVKTRDHRKKKSGVKTRDHRKKKKNKVKTRDHRDD